MTLPTPTAISPSIRFPIGVTVKHVAGAGALPVADLLSTVTLFLTPGMVFELKSPW